MPKVTLSFKTPDVIDEAVEGMSTSDQEKVRKACEKFVEYEEYIYVYIDTDTGEATVRPI